ncbi:MAG: hypothetical protein LC772_01600 [Chloroflexi bacterium]|nr:hypothetical protein [Chloroflexota bacterium]
MDIIDLHVLHFNLFRSAAGQGEERQARKLRNHLAPIHELWERHAELNKLSSLKLDACDGNKADFHKMPTFIDRIRVIQGSAERRPLQLKYRPQP